MTALNKTIARLLRETANRIDAGNSELSDDEAMDIVNMLTHRVLSKAKACEFLNLSRSRFDDLVRDGKIPEGRKRVGFKEKIWYQDELEKVKKK